MKKRIILFLLLLLFPVMVFAISDSYVDNIADLVGVKKESDKINLYLFHSADCSHCAKEVKWLEEIKEEYKDYLNVYTYEVTYDKDNMALLNRVAASLSVPTKSVPLTFLGSEHYNGFSDATASKIEEQIKEYAGLDSNTSEVKIPIMGKVDVKKVSIPLVAVVLGFIDGFNPCAMWILLFLINMFFGMKDRKKAWILGMTFLLVSGLVYFLSMLGINFVLGIATIKWMKIAIALFILIAGILNMKKYFTKVIKD